MRLFYFLLIGSLAMLPVRARGQSRDPVKIFSTVFVPAMQEFETAAIQTNLRGFILRADSFPGIKQAEPSIYGISLNVGVADAGANAQKIDKTEQNEGGSCRKVQLPPRSPGEDSLEIEFSYGKKASRQVVATIYTRIDGLLR